MATPGRPKRFESITVDQRQDRSSYNQAYYLLTKGTKTKQQQEKRRKTQQKHYEEKIKPYRAPREPKGTEILYFKCPVCMLNTPINRFTQRVLLNPSDIGHIISKKAMGHYGFVGTGHIALMDSIKEYPEVYNRLKDVVLGLIHAFYNHGLITENQLPNWKEINARNTEIYLNEKKVRTLTQDNFYLAETEEKKKRDENLDHLYEDYDQGE